MKMNKKYLIPLCSLMLLATVFAVGYYVTSITVKVNVNEPFEISYAVVGDGGNWDGTTTCADYTGDYVSYDNGIEIDAGGLYAGEGRLVCTKINNKAQADIGYTIANTILNTNNVTKQKCEDAFGLHSVDGTAVKSTETIQDIALVVSGSAEPVENCKIKVDVIRG
jgi:hypothetical protein